MHKYLILFFCAFLTVHVSNGQEIDDFTLPDVSSGDEFSLALHTDEKAVVLIFMSNSCPFATAYLDRLEQMRDDFPEILIVMVNAFTTSRESMVNMKTTWLNWSTTIPYLADKEQRISGLLGIDKSPTAVILKPIRNNFSVYYIGQIDNNPQIAEDVKEAYLIDNIRTLLENKPPKHANNQTVGCTIR